MKQNKDLFTASNILIEVECLNSNSRIGEVRRTWSIKVLEKVLDAA